MDAEGFAEDLAKRHTYIDTYEFYLAVASTLKARRDAINDLRQFAARRARREAQLRRLSELQMLLDMSMPSRSGSGSYFYRDSDIGWLHRERRRWQRKQR